MAKIRREFGKQFSVRAAELDDERGEVTVEFADGRTKTYANFSAELLAEWGADPKSGQWFSKNVRLRPDLHPEVVAPDQVTLVVAEEKTIGDPASERHDLQPNTLDAERMGEPGDPAAATRPKKRNLREWVRARLRTPRS